MRMEELTREFTIISSFLSLIFFCGIRGYKGNLMGFHQAERERETQKIFWVS